MHKVWGIFSLAAIGREPKQYKIWCYPIRPFPVTHPPCHATFNKFLTTFFVIYDKIHLKEESHDQHTGC
ncbi:conserved hypothetical protein [Treponema primitia ZAS-2]|uniref:Uncharacterized protein n=1 Tax=Treponema primitia (strain ATCC BAA-887 / DSM 12427 / ZAS-2) TaxID=545694 RepID=F5YQN1_TREPZ|nr:conserved hypothetical protein [Treponema primitia ZAS-2]